MWKLDQQRTSLIELQSRYKSITLKYPAENPEKNMHKRKAEHGFRERVSSG